MAKADQKGDKAMTTALAIFAKTPSLSPVKTRLAADIGTEAATVFYRYSIRCLAELAVSLQQMSGGDIVPYWAVGEAAGLDDPLWGGLNRLWTGPGSLGQRLGHVYTRLLAVHDRVILIGTDSPQLSPDVILDAHSQLIETSGSVIGPADDGGYYLFGSDLPIDPIIWTSVPYSVPNTCAMFVEALRPLGPIALLDQDFDIDTYDDLVRLVSAKTRLRGIAQRKLLDWAVPVIAPPSQSFCTGLPAS